MRPYNHVWSLTSFAVTLFCFVLSFTHSSFLFFTLPSPSTLYTLVRLYERISITLD